MLEWLQDANGLERVANSFMLICLGLAAVFGLRAGKVRAKAEPVEKIEVVDAAMSGRHVSMIVNALNENTKSMTDVKLALNKNTAADYIMVDDMREVGRDIRELIRRMKR